MGRKRFYCDFCDKYLANNPQTRKKHNGGVQHSSIKRAHYALFREPEEILLEECSKQKCRRFLQTGNCDYGEGCRFSHMTPERYAVLLEQVQSKKRRSELPARKLEDWLRTIQVVPESPSVEEKTPQIESATGSAFLPEILQDIPNLPLSLQLPTGAVVESDLGDRTWG